MKITTGMNSQQPMKKYALIFAIAYLVNTVIILGVSYALGAGGGTGLNIVAAIAASFIVAWRFAKEQKRIPTDAEKKSYSWAALAGVWVVSLILVAGVFGLSLSAEELQALLELAASEISPAVAFVRVLVFSAVSAVYYVAIRWSFAWYVAKACNASQQPMKKYALIFAIAYLVNTVLIGGVSYALGAGGGAALGIVATIAASFIAAWRFAKEQKRIPTDAEKKSYSWAALAGVWVVSLILVAGVFGLILSAEERQVVLVLAASGISPALAFLAFVGVLVISAVYYVAIRWAFAWYVAKACNALPMSSAKRKMKWLM